MIRPRNSRIPTKAAIPTAFVPGAAAVMALFHAMATERAALAQQLVTQGEILSALQAGVAKSSRTRRKPPARAMAKRTASLRTSGDKPPGSQPGHDRQPLKATPFNIVIVGRAAMMLTTDRQ